MNIFKYKKYFILLALPVITVSVFLFWRGDTHISQTRTIILTDTGYQPSELTISKGDTVTFSTTRGKEFWPASNLHPSHSIFPEFDPRQPVQPDQTWSFRFDKNGEWKFHDHLAPSFRGLIIVKDSFGWSKDTDCGKSEDKKQCWQEQIQEVLETKGLDRAFTLVAELYEAEPAFAGQCHDFSHILGEAAYHEFKKGKDLELTRKTAYCGYGFYHGFMEALLQDTRDMDMARKFCAYAQTKLAGETSDAEGACYHGIGHGAVDGGNPQAWGNPQAMIEPALQICYSVTGKKEIKYTGDFLYRCVTGTYNALEILSADEKYKLVSLNKNPFAFCLTQPVSYRAGCYVNLTPILIRSVKGDNSAAFAAMEKISEPGNAYTVRGEVIMSLAHELVRQYITMPGYAGDIIRQCRSLSDPRSRLPCIEGLSGGLIKYGEPEKEYIKWLEFCSGSGLKSDEMEICYSHVLSRLRIWYSPQKSVQICGMVPQQYQMYCK